MRVERFNAVADFYQAVEPFLLQHEVENTLPLGLLGDLKRGASWGQEPYLAVVYNDAGQVIAAGIRTPPHNLILPLSDSTDALALLAQDVFDLYGGTADAMPGVLGTQDNARTFASDWTTLTGQQAEIAVHERLYRLEHVIPVMDVPGRVFQATITDYDLLRDWLTAFHVEALGEADEDDVKRSLDRRLKDGIGAYYLWEVDGTPLSMAGYTGFTPNGVRIGPVYTPREHRRKGYGSALTAALSQLLLDGGRQFCFLFTNLANPTANHIYQTIGYEPVCDVDLYRFHPAQA